MAADPERLTRYLEGVLALDPFADAERLLGLRRRYVAETRRGRDRTAGETDDAPESVEDVEEARRRASQALARAQETFWDRTPEELRPTLEALDLDALPDLARHRDRLLVACDLWYDVDDIEQDERVSLRLTDALKEVLVAPERTAAGLRTRFLQQHAREARDRINKKSLRVLRQQYPGVFAHERRWLERIRLAKAERRMSRKMKGGLGAAGCLGIWYLVALLVRGFQALFEWITGG